MSSVGGTPSLQIPATKHEVFDELGCGVCGSRWSSSFRNTPIGCRLCNSCHCKSYRLRRKTAGLTGQAAVSKLRALQQRQQQQQGQGRVGGSIPASRTAFEGSPVESPAGSYQRQAAAAAGAGLPARVSQLALEALQRRVLERVGGTPAELATMLHCAFRAQQGTPYCMQRAVVGLLPQVELRLPGDPPAMRHKMACLLEAVALTHAEEGKGDGQQQQQLGDAHLALRLTMFAAAGSVACWHEGPAAQDLTLAFCSATKQPLWSTSPDGFSIHFPSPFCPQVNLFAACHNRVVTAGRGVLDEPVLMLVPPSPQARLPTAAPSRQQQGQQQHQQQQELQSGSSAAVGSKLLGVSGLLPLSMDPLPLGSQHTLLGPAFFF